MRFMPLAMLGLLLAIAPIVAAQAADRPAGGQGRTQTEVTAKAPVKTTGKAAATRRPAAGSAAQRRAPQQLRQATQRRAAQRAPQDAVQRSARVRSQLGVTPGFAGGDLVHRLPLGRERRRLPQPGPALDPWPAAGGRRPGERVPARHHGHPGPRS